MSDYHLTSLYILTKESNIKVIMQEMTTLSNTFGFQKILLLSTTGNV